MKKSILTAAVAMALGLSSFNALASVDIDLGTGAATYASEIDPSNVSTLLGTGLDSTVALGFGFSLSNSTGYVRYDLVGGTWGASLTGGSTGDLTVSNASNVALATGGAVGTSSVVFNITSGPAGLSPSETVVLALAAKGVVLIGSSSGVTLRYRLYANAVDAANGNANTLKDKSASLIGFAPGLTFTTSPNTSIASVSSATPFTEFLNRVAPQPTDLQTARIGALNLGVDTGVLDANGVALASANTILDVTTSVTVSGDFGAVTTVGGSVWLDTGEGCASSTVGTGVVATDKQSVEIDLPVTISPVYVCYQGDGVEAFKTQTPYTVSMNPVATSTDYLSSKVNFTDLELGSIKRDGTELQATFMTGGAADANRFVFINTGSSAAPITDVKVMMNDGTTFTPGTLSLPKSIPAGKRLAIQATEIFTALSSGTAAGVIFSIGATDMNIQGTYQLKLPGSTVQTVVQMVRPGTN